MADCLARFSVLATIILTAALLTEYASSERFEFGLHQEAVNYDGFGLLEKLRHGGVPQDIPEEFDCAVRHLAYNVSLKMQPERAPMRNVWNALQLSTVCGKTFPGDSAPQAGDRSVPVGERSPATHWSDYTVYVDAKRGDDSSDDATTVDKPFRTVHRALQHTRWLRSKQEAGALAANIVLRGGVHFLNETIQITAADSSTTLDSYPGETAILSGGRPLRLEWRAYNVSNTTSMVVEPGQNNIYGQVDSPGASAPTIHFMGKTDTAAECEQMCHGSSSSSSATTTTADPCNSWTWHGASLGPWKSMCYQRSDHVWAPRAEADVTSGNRPTSPNIYVSEVGTDAGNLALGLLVADNVTAMNTGEFRRAVRARFPNVVDQQSAQFPNGWIGGGVSWTAPKDMGKAKATTVSSPTYDLNPLFTNFRLGSGGPCSIFTPPESYWCSDNAEGGGPHMFESPSGVAFDKAVLHNAPYNASLFARTAVLHTWRPAHWSSWMFEFADFDAATLSGKFSRGGFQGARGASTGAEWWLDNVFEELDFPNEYFYNPLTGQLFYFHNGTGTPPEDLQFVAANLKTLVSITGSMDDPVKNFTIQNVVLTGAAYTYMDPHGVPSGGDWALQRSGAVFVEGASNLTVRDCLFKNLDGNALFLSGFVHDSLISGNEFTLIGDSAMAAWGYTKLIDGTSGEQPRRNTIESNFIHEIGLYQKQASCWFQAKSAQTRLSKNICFNGPRAGVNFNDGFGGANVMEDNVLFNLCRESSDHAPFNSWDRQPFVTDVANPGVPSVYPAVNNFTHNFVLGNYASSMCFDNDDGSAYYHHSDNYLVYGGHKSNFYGHDKVSTNNYNIYPKVYELVCFRMSFAAVNRTHADSYRNCTCVLQGVDNEHMYSILPTCDLGKPDTLFFKTGGNTVYSPTGKAQLKVCGKTMSSDDWLAMKLDPGTVVKVSPDVATIIGWGKSLFGIDT